ncbi:tryptophan--tRNA ligase [Marispirochaeta sp.]|jgi:tryptophanyl-tRNA synthetase|uniref:tryptophan--tRNA ligase n=1 Tax=Marispirochaeta sp. TaxID=2038653 RepID=UPI0029C8E5F2|nr:tryptophan--tRNA ligase [Marispirochaeta sp.]
MKKRIALTGIKPTGTPHIGNYFGAIKPALALIRDYDTRFFIADYHALNSERDPQRLKEQTHQVAATWLACGLDPEKSLVYKQSAVPETFELTTILMAFTPKGLMNRAHAYKAISEENRSAGKDPDKGINMGLYTYPVLMAADILLFNANVVPVGRDQKQHIEMTADIAQAINGNYNKELLTIPAPLINELTQIIPGMDGRKMSKSYNNTIPLFLPPKKLRKLVMKIVTNSQGIEEPKDPETCNVFRLFRLFASEEEQEALQQRYRAGGMGWGEAKQALFECMEREIAPHREKYEEFIQNTDRIDSILAEGADRARETASETLSRLRKAVGIV